MMQNEIARILQRFQTDTFEADVAKSQMFTTDVIEARSQMFTTDVIEARGSAT